MPWISIAEIPVIIDFIRAKKELTGPLNLVSPLPLMNAQFTKILADVLHRPAFFHVPAFILKTVLGEMADELLLASARVRPQKLIDSKYQFQYPDLKDALQNLLNLN
jgi:NAD dependent epimerase/dehydratase family enzyme